MTVKELDLTKMVTTYLNILIFSIEFPPDVGGAGSYARNLAVGLSNIGHSVTILTSHKKKNSNKEKLIDYELKKYKKIKVIRKLFVPKLYIFIFGNYCKKLLQKNTYDILLLADAHAQKSIAYSGITFPNPTWTAFHGSEIINYFCKQTRLFNVFKGSKKLKEFFNKIDGIIAVSHDMRNHILHELPELSGKIHVVHHGIDKSIYSRGGDEERVQARKLLRLPQKKNILFSASRLVREKGQNVLIKSMPGIIDSVPDALLLIAGEGPDKAYLENLINENGLKSHVFLVGALSLEEMVKYFHACDLFVLLSKRESFGLVYLEANACGRIVVAGKTGGVPEAVEDMLSGILVEPIDVEAVTNTIVGLLKKHKQRRALEISAYERVIESFTVEKMAESTLSVVNSQIGER